MSQLNLGSNMTTLCHFAIAVTAVFELFEIDTEVKQASFWDVYSAHIHTLTQDHNVVNASQGNSRNACNSRNKQTKLHPNKQCSLGSRKRRSPL